ncbi:RhoGAP-domain-containing protein [Hesseltinella vesiculosa]|uniref:RhoGAP-domain-containing protein n=1 Tax=Hesseltinella vesiculosa TaxID=101127 RepID=A0A1X2GBU6_9FUNG|nr:RhoGAP-domain-containing protein [Hesseltinella vesiculosa]
MANPQPGYANMEELTQLRAQNEQLWKIVERQRTMIQSLQKENSHLVAERDSLQDKVNSMDQSKRQRASLFISPETMRALTEQQHPDDEPASPMPPPRSPYRANRTDREQWHRSPPSVPPPPVPQISTAPPSSPPLPPIPSVPPPLSLSVHPTQQQPPVPTTPTSPRHIIMEKDAQFMQKFSSKSTAGYATTISPPPPPVPSRVDLPTPVASASTPTHHLEDTSLSSVSSIPQRPATANALHHRSKRSSHIFLPDTPTQPPPPLPVPTVDVYQHNNATSTTLSSTTSTATTSTQPPQQQLANSASPFAGGITNIVIKVLGSSIRYNEKHREVVSFIISVGKKSEDPLLDQDELWRVEKFYSHFLDLDAKLKKHRFGQTRIKLPDKALFSTNSPSKVDRRKHALEQYLQTMITSSMDDNSDVCEFLSTNVVDHDVFASTDNKEGYLTKRGKNFGGWKRRYFVLKGNVLEYYESKDGNQLGSIRLVNAQIGRQSNAASAEEAQQPPQPLHDNGTNNAFRHAFLIIEQKRPGHVSRHILCADSDQERDGWVDALLKHVVWEETPSPPFSDQPASGPSAGGQVDPNHTLDARRKKDVVGVAVSSESTDSLLSPAESSSSSLSPPRHLARRSSMVNLLNTQEEAVVLPARAVSPSPAFGRHSEEASSVMDEKKKAKRMTFWGKKMFNSSSNSLDNSTASRGLLSRGQQERVPTNPVFGVPLDDAVRISRASDSYQLPSIVFRCIDYLNAKNAELEEGLYRLSGSNATIKALKLKFDLEGDVDLLAVKEEYDVHVVAGLLKMWLRELPTSVLTRELRMDFLHVIDLLDRKDRVNELGRLVSQLPIVNYTLLRALTAHLIHVVRHSDVNKMTMRNVSIVFSPTLGIPGTIFNLFMSEFDYIFWTTEDGDAAPRMLLDDEEEPQEKPTQVQQLGRRPTLQLRDGRSNRNSVNYREAAPNSFVGIEKNHQGQIMLEEMEDEVNDLALSDDDYSITSDDRHPSIPVHG